MLNKIKEMLGFGPGVDFAQLVKEGAQIIDVRTTAEFQSGHIRGSINIPLNTLESKLSKVRKDKPVITCCASGVRSASAKGILKSRGYNEVHNGGGWMSLQRKL
jgi:phage shock protein E